MKAVKRGNGPWRESYRPATLDEFWPSTDVEAIKNHFMSKDRSHVYMYHGDTGTGKTTMAYILGKWANCESPGDSGPCGGCDNCKISDQLIEDTNMGYKTKVDDTREIIDRVVQKPLIDANRILILDEAHALTTQAQKAWLKVIEDPKPWLYVFFCTTDPSKFLPDIKNRCKQFEFKRFGQNSAVDLLTAVATNEGLTLPKDTAVDIYRSVGGRARELINALQEWSDGGEWTTDQGEEQRKITLSALLNAVLLPDKTAAGWQQIWQHYNSLLEQESENSEKIRISAVMWLWVAAQNKQGWHQKFTLTRLMEVMELLSEPIQGTCEQQQLATRLFKAWKME